MADEQAGTQAGKQAGQAVPQPMVIIPTPATAEETKPAPAPADDSPEGKVARLRAELIEAEAALPKQPGVTNVRVEPPHSEFHFGGVVVGSDYTPVNELLVPSLLQAAYRSGVELTTE